MRRLIALFAFAIAMPVSAQQPPKLEPLPEPPPSAATPLDEAALAELGVKIQPGERAEEFVAAGKRVIRVTQANGAVYYLIEKGGDVTVVENPTGSNLSVPQWLILKW